MTESNKLLAVYNGSEKIAANGFTMQSNYVLPVLARMVNEGLLLQSGADVIQAILTFKHTEENPFPSREGIALLLGKGVDYVKKALKSIKASGIIKIVKAGRKNTYDFKPFFALLEKFIVEFKEKKNHAVKIADLLKVKLQKKSEKDFSWSEEYTGEDQEIVPVEEEVQEEEVLKVNLPKLISDTLKVYGIDSEGVQAVEQAYTLYAGKVDDKLFVEKIVASRGKKNFANYFTTCITSAYTTGEKPKVAAVQEPKNSKHPYTGKKPVRTEIVPDWLEKQMEAERLAKEEAEKKEKEKTVEQKIEEATSVTQLEPIEAELQDWLNTIPEHIEANREMKLLQEKKAKLQAEFEVRRKELEEKLKKMREA
jgi:hypothetical protein